MKKVKHIKFKLELEGKGIVNYDHGDQKKIIYNTNLDHLKNKHKNVSYAKKNFYGDKDNTTYKIKISSDCLRHEIFKEDVKFKSPNLQHSPQMLYGFIATPMALLRGYLELSKTESFKRKSPLTITSAEQTNDAKSYLEFFSSSAPKTVKDVDDESSDNTIFTKESVGDITYECDGIIDISELQFISCDQLFDRYSFNPDNYELYKQFMKLQLPEFDSELGYYTMNNTSVKLPEYGVMLSNDVVNKLVRVLFEKMMKINIVRNNSYAKTFNLKYKLVADPIEDISDDNWVDIKSIDDINNISFDMEDYYIMADVDESVKIRTNIMNGIEKEKEGDKGTKKSKTAKK